jgi:hypothetical protein
LKCNPIVKIELLIHNFLCNHVRDRMTIPAVASAPTYQYPPETSTPTNPYLPLPSMPTYPSVPSASGPVRPSCMHPPACCRLEGPRPASRTCHCVRTRLHVCTRLHDDVAVQVAANVDKVNQIYHGRSVNARLTLIGQAQRSIGHTGRVAHPTDNPALKR